MKARIEACLVFEATVEKSGVRQESLRGLHYLFLSGEEMARGDFKSMLGMSDRGATDALGALAAWTAYAVGNARALKHLTHLSAHDWSLLIGIVTGTIAGQVILEGFLDLSIPCWQRRLITRGLALIPALAGVLLTGANMDGAEGMAAERLTALLRRRGVRVAGGLLVDRLTYGDQARGTVRADTASGTWAEYGRMA